MPDSADQSGSSPAAARASRAGQGASPGRSEANPSRSRAAPAASTPLTSVGLCSRPLEHGVEQVVERGPDGVHVGLLALGGEAVRAVGRGQVARQVDPQPLADDAGRAEQVDQHVPAAGGQADLLGQLPLRGDQRVLAGVVEQPGGRLGQPVPDRVPVLPDEDDALRPRRGR